MEEMLYPLEIFNIQKATVKQFNRRMHKSNKIQTALILRTNA